MLRPLHTVSCRIGLVVAATCFFSPPASGQLGTWGDRGTFPHQAVMLILESESRAWNLKNGESVGNDAAEGRAIAELKNELTRLINEQRGKRVIARLSVMRVANKTLVVCPDVSWGWPTQFFGDVAPETPYEKEVEKCNAVMLKLSGKKDEVLGFSIGEEVPEEFAKQAVWNDKVLVEFTVESVQRTRRPKKIAGKYDHAFGMGGSSPKDDSHRPYFEVRINDLKFVKAIPPTDGPRERPRLWPTPGTLPTLYQELLGQIGTVGERFEVEDRIRDFSRYVSHYQPQAIAIGKVGVVTDKVVVLQPELDMGDFPLTAILSPPLEELQREIERNRDTELEQGLKVSVATLGRDRAMKMKTGDRVLIAFRVAGISPEVSRAIDGRIRGEMLVQAADLKVGTDEQLLAYLPDPVVPSSGADQSAAAIIAATPTAPRTGTLRATSDPAREGEEGAAGPVWGELGSFPEIVKEQLSRGERPEARGLEGKRAKARLAVMEVTPTEVHLLPDATWGFPTLPPEEVVGFFQQHHSAIRLQATGVADRTERIALTIGEHISEELARKLAWDDKVIVDFRVDDIEFAASPTESGPALTGGYGYSDSDYSRRAVSSSAPVDDASPERCVVQISSVRFVGSPQADLVVSLRTSLWPGPGTMPFMLNLANGGKGFERISERSPYSDYASRTTFRGSAVFLFQEVRGDSICFDSRPLISPTKHAELQLGDGGEFLSMPVGAFALEERHRIGRPGFRHLLHFDATVIDGKGAVGNPYWNHRVVELKNVRPGTQAELKEAEVQLASMEKNAEQFRAAWHREIQDRQHAAQLAKAAAEEAKRQEAAGSWKDMFSQQGESSDGAVEQTATTQENTTQKAEVAEKPAEPDSWSFRRADWLKRVWPALGPLIGWEALATCAFAISFGLVKAKRDLSS